MKSRSIVIIFLHHVDLREPPCPEPAKGPVDRSQTSEVLKTSEVCDLMPEFPTMAREVEQGRQVIL